MEDILKQVKARGYLAMQEMAQLNNIGVPVTPKLCTLIGKDVTELYTEIMKGLITYEQVVEALNK